MIAQTQTNMKKVDTCIATTQQKLSMHEEDYFCEQYVRKRKLNKKKELNISGNKIAQEKMRQRKSITQQQLELLAFRQFFDKQNHSQPILIQEKDNQFIVKIVYKNGDLYRAEKGWIGFFRYDMYLLNGTQVQHKMENGNKFLLGINQMQGYQKGLGSMSQGQIATIFMTSQYTFKRQGQLPKIPIYSTLRLDIQMVRFQIPAPQQLNQLDKIQIVECLYCQAIQLIQKMKQCTTQESFKELQSLQHLMKKAKDIIISSCSSKISQIQYKIDKILTLVKRYLYQPDFRQSQANFKTLFIDMTDKCYHKDSFSSQINAQKTSKKIKSAYNFDYESKIDRKGLFKQQKIPKQQLKTKIQRNNIAQWALGNSRIKNCYDKLKLGQQIMANIVKRQQRNLRRKKNLQKIKAKQQRQKKLQNQRIFIETDQSSIQEVSDDSSIDLQEFSEAQIKERAIKIENQKIRRLEDKMKQVWTEQNYNQGFSIIKNTFQNEKQQSQNQENIMSLILGAVGDSLNKVLPTLSNQQKFQIYNIK